MPVRLFPLPPIFPPPPSPPLDAIERTPLHLTGTGHVLDLARKLIRFAPGWQYLQTRHACLARFVHEHETQPVLRLHETVDELRIVRHERVPMHELLSANYETLVCRALPLICRELRRDFGILPGFHAAAECIPDPPPDVPLARVSVDSAMFARYSSITPPGVALFVAAMSEDGATPTLALRLSAALTDLD
jgi:hypothetical protein